MTPAISRRRWPSSRSWSTGMAGGPTRPRPGLEGRRLGLGIACYVEGTGVGPYEGGHVQVETSGKVKVATGLTSQGQGHQTAFAQIVADELGVELSDIEVTTGDTRRFPYAVGTFASRAAVMSGSAIALAARAARAKILKVAADALEADADDLELVDGMVRVKGAPAPRSRWAPSPCCPTRCVMPSTRRPRPRPSSWSVIPMRLRWPRTTSPGSKAATTTRRCDRPSPTGCTR